MKTLKFLPFIILFIFIPKNIIAQITIDGTITDSELNPISNALVEIIDQDDTSNYYSTYSDQSGSYTVSNIFTDIATRTNNLPSNYLVLGNYPNPFNPSTIIYYELPKAENIEIKIYDILGREVRTLFNNFRKAGVYQITWDGRNDWGSAVSAGIYLCRLKTENNFKVHKMVLLDGGSTSATAVNIKLHKSYLQKISKINGYFNFSIRVSGNLILESDFKYLSCTGDTTINLMVPKILQTVTIGPEGGKIEIENFSLTIPEGAFTEYTEFRLAVELNIENPFETSLTDVYRVEGFPLLYSKPLKLKFKYESNPQDSVLAAVGSRGIDPTSNYEDINFDYYSVKDSSGYILFNLPIQDTIPPTISYKSNMGLNESPIDFRLFMCGKRLNYLLSDKFRMYNIPLGLEIYSEEIFNNFEEIYEWYRSLLDYGDIFASRSTKQINFKSKYPNDLSRPSRYLYHTLYYYQFTNTGRKIYGSEFYLNLCKDKINVSNMHLIKRDQAHYLYMLFPYIEFSECVINGPDIQYYREPKQFWFHHAIATWSEEYFPQVENFVPLDYYLHLKAPFNGIQTGIGSKASEIESHGIGMSALLKYLTQDYGNDIVRKFFNGLKKNHNALEVILDTLNNRYNISESIWWPSFFKEFIQGNIYNVPSEEFLTNISETIEFNDGDTLKYIDETYNDLSAKLFKIKINSEEIKNNKSLQFKIGPESLNLDYVKALVFGLSNDQLTFISEGIDFPVGNLNKYDALLACVVNSGNDPPYTGTSNIELDIRTKDSNLPFEGIMTINGHFIEYVNYKSATEEREYETDLIYHHWTGKVKLINESTYKGSWDEVDQFEYNHKGEMTVVIDPTTKNLLYFEAKEIKDGDFVSVIDEKIISHNINRPRFSTGTFWWNYLGKDGDACSMVEKLEYTKGNDEWRETMKSYYCNATSSIMISFNFE